MCVCMTGQFFLSFFFLSCCTVTVRPFLCRISSGKKCRLHTYLLHFYVMSFLWEMRSFFFATIGWFFFWVDFVFVVDVVVDVCIVFKVRVL